MPQYLHHPHEPTQITYALNAETIAQISDFYILYPPQDPTHSGYPNLPCDCGKTCGLELPVAIVASGIAQDGCNEERC